MTISGKTKVRFPHGVNAKTCFPSFTRLLILFVLKTAFTFTFNLTAKMQSPSRLMHASESLCVMNCLEFSVQNSHSVRHSPNWKIISLLTLKTSLLHSPWSRKSLCEHHFFFFFVLKPSSSKVAFRADLPFASLLLLLSARRCWGKLNLAKWGVGGGSRRIQSFWFG